MSRGLGDVYKRQNKYAAILGEDLCRQDKLEDLIAIMQEGQANTVSEAIAVYKGQKASR